jgi:septal ring factor EnvC (AmiA/AmiB activator)
MTDDNDTLTAKQARALAQADAEMRRLAADLAIVREALAQAERAIEAERRARQLGDVERERARVYILYTEALYPGDDNQIELLTKWLEACKRRGEG